MKQMKLLNTDTVIMQFFERNKHERLAVFSKFRIMDIL
jgi:hypothetical protein